MALNVRRQHVVLGRSVVVSVQSVSPPEAMFLILIPSFVFISTDTIGVEISVG